MIVREVKKTKKPQLVTDGAGVELNRVISINEVDDTDPFLMLDHFENSDPDQKMAGFPWHPHRGIETITYMIEGSIRHEDSLGNKGDLNSGDVQWMTAGSGIIHQEMPIDGASNIYRGFQLWANLPSTHKMMKPRYQDIPAKDIPEVKDDDGTIVRVITGEYGGEVGPVKKIITNPGYLDLTIPPNVEKSITVESGKNAFIYIFEGNGYFPELVEDKTLVIFSDGDTIKVKAGDKGLRFILVSGKPINEAIAWNGPIVMNTEEELQVAFTEYQNGTFLKK